MTKEKKKSKANLVYLFLTCLLFLFLASLATITVKTFDKTYCKEVTATIHTVLNRYDADGVKIYFPVYYYTVGDNQYCITGFHSSNKNKYKVGDEVTLYYNTDDPNDCVEKTQIPYIIEYSLYGISGLLFVIFAILFIRYRKLKKK